MKMAAIDANTATASSSQADDGVEDARGADGDQRDAW